MRSRLHHGAALALCAVALAAPTLVIAQGATPSPVAASPGAASVATVVASKPAVVLGFAQAFDAALGNDAQLRAARYERESTQGSVPIARAALLPTVTMSVTDAINKGRREFPNSLNQQVTTNIDYAAPQASLQMRAPLFNWESISRYRQALVQSDAADAVFRVRGADLVDRLTLAYLQRLLASENISLAQTQILALEGQQLRAEQRLQRGEGTRIELAETQAQLEVARVRLVEAKDQVTVARRSLARITGLDVDVVRDMPARFRPPAMVPQRLDDWLSLANARNPSVQARTQQVEIARMAIERNRAGHYPRLDAVASLARSSNESIANLNQSSKIASVGLQLNVPIFAGFGVQASVNQSQSDLAKAEADLSNERENVALEVHKQYLAVSNGQPKIEAQERAVAAMEVALDGITRGVGAGLRTLADVLDAQSKVFSARHDLAQARYDYLLARTRLQAQSGAPLAEIVFDIEQLLAVTP